MSEVSNNDADLANVLQKVAQDLSKVGVGLELKIITIPDVMARLNGVKPYEGQMHIFNFGSGPSMDMMRPINAYYNCEAQQKWTCIQAAEPIIKAANSEFDPAKRSAHLRQLAQIYHDEAPVLYLYDQHTLDATSGKVKNYKNENWRINWADIELTR